MNGIVLSLNQVTEMMSRLTYFHGLALGTLSQLAGGAQQVTVARGEAVFRKGEAATALFVVVSGQIKVYLPLPNATEKVVSLTGQGESFGIASLVLGEPYTSSAVAKADSHLLRVDRHTLLSQAQQDGELAGRLLHAVSRRVVDLMKDMESCAHRSSLQRVTCYLLQQRPDPSAEAFEIQLPSTKREVAAKLSLTHETLSRVLQLLGREGAILVRGRLIQVLNSNLLIQINLSGCATPAVHSP
ncbi:MAG: Crp/Fnr family transcriptional regulator [Gallionellaceae bacterium]|nr:Crp/Fnr family transcriptional regulator [Gallionellaceae bacterium]